MQPDASDCAKVILSNERKGALVTPFDPFLSILSLLLPIVIQFGFSILLQLLGSLLAPP